MAGDCEDVDCREALHNLERFLDGELPKSRLSEISSHLAACYPCADRAKFEEQLRHLVRENCAIKAPQRLIDKISLRLDAVTQEGT